jgi:Peptidase inhibitor family I36
MKSLSRLFGIAVAGAQAAALQAQVDGYLAKVGGTQVAANEIRTAAGADLLVPLPGETTARSLDGTNAPAAASCPFEDLCAWQGTNFTGARMTAFTCGRDVSIPWVGNGSWWNNQTRGTDGWFENSNDSIRAFTGGAPSSLASYNWTPVFAMEPC